MELVHQKRKSTYNTYLNAIARYPLLTPEQEIDLGRKVQRARELEALERELTERERRQVRIGKRAKERCINSNLRLVVTVAKKYHNMTKTMDLMDLIQEGNCGLVTAVNKFDPTKGYRFSTYAYWWIRQAITRAVQYQDTIIRLPGNVGEMAYSWGHKFSKLQAKLGRTPTYAELADVFKVTPQDVELFLARGQNAVSLDVVQTGTDELTLLDTLFAKDNPDATDEIDTEQQLQMLGSALECLSERERDIVKRRWGLEGSDQETLACIGKPHNLSRERVRQILTTTYRKIRVNMARVGEQPRTVLDQIA